MATVMYDSLYHHVPCTPNFPRLLCHDAEVPSASTNRPLTGTFLQDFAVPSTPERVICERRSDDVRLKIRDDGFAHVSDIQFFKDFAEQVVPYTPRQQYLAQETSGTTRQNQTSQRREVARSRLASVSRSVLSANSRAKVNVEDIQLVLFSGDDIFA